MHGPPAREDDDALLVEKARKGDLDAFGQLYEKHRDRVYRVAYRYVHNRADALDLAQDVFVRAYESLPRFKGESKFTTWLMRIATNTCIDHRRSASVRQAAELEENWITGDQRVPGSQQPAHPSRGLEREEMRAALDAALDQLSDEHRAVFVLHLLEGMPYKEIAQVLDCPIGTVMSRLHYARKRLQGLLSWIERDEP
jgi:RNA polymerase sigma-70 factor (ECF subfamily)